MKIEQIKKFEDLKIGKKYWVINGHWEFKVHEVTQIHAKIWVYALSKFQYIDKKDFDRYKLQTH